MAAAATAATDMSTGSQITHVLATNAGLESVVAAEVSSVAGAGLIVPRPFGVPGYVGVGGLPSGGEERLQNLRSIHVAMQFHAHFTLSLPPGATDLPQGTLSPGILPLRAAVSFAISNVFVPALKSAASCSVLCQGAAVSRRTRKSCSRSCRRKSLGT